MACLEVSGLTIIRIMQLFFGIGTARQTGTVLIVLGFYGFMKIQFYYLFSAGFSALRIAETKLFFFLISFTEHN